MLKLFSFVRKLFYPTQVYLILRRTEYKSGDRTTNIVRILSDKTKADRLLKNLNDRAEKALTPTMTTLEVKSVIFQLAEYDLE